MAKDGMGIVLQPRYLVVPADLLAGQEIMNPCDPTHNRPVPSTGVGERPCCGGPLNRECAPTCYTRKSSLLRTDPDRCPDCGSQTAHPWTFNSLHISHLPLKVDGKIEHLFVAILNGEAVGQVLALKQEWGACGLRMLYVAQKHRHMGIGTRLVSRAEVFAHNEHCKEIEIAVHKGNVEGRKFWIRRRFIDDESRDMSLTPEYRCMVKPI